jgi:hypothetical protein
MNRLQLADKAYKITLETNVFFTVSETGTNLNPSFIIEPTRYKDKKLDGMQVVFAEGIFEVSQYMAGKNENELHIYLETKSLKAALKNMLKGNKYRKILKKWD